MRIPNGATSIIDIDFYKYFDSELHKIISNQKNIDNFKKEIPTSSEAATLDFSSSVEFNSSFSEDDEVSLSHEYHWLVMVVYGLMMLFGGVGNLLLLAALFKDRRRRLTVILLLKHLAVADTCLTCGVIPLEMGWRYTKVWLAGNISCKVLVTLRAFGLYLSSNIIVSVTIDRFFVVVLPLRAHNAKERNKKMLCGAWVMALACSIPQIFMFSEKHHSNEQWFEQCVSFRAFSNLEMTYNMFCVCAMYLGPLFVISGSYATIILTLKQYGALNYHWSPMIRGSRRRSGRNARANWRFLGMSFTIVIVFALCWLPYAVMTLWYAFDRKGASQVPPLLQDLFFAMAVSNSCMNPLVYGTFALDLKTFVRNLLREWCCTEDPEREGNSRDIRLVNMRTVLTPSMTRGRRVRFTPAVTRSEDSEPVRTPA